MDVIRKLLFKILGLKLYLRVISRIYVSLIMKGKLKKEYPEIHYLSAIVREGYVCIDIGANLGYYSTVLSSIVKKTGHVYAVEPIPLFGKIWKKNVKVSRYSNLTLLPYALGSEERTVQMGIPERDGVIHHGMTKITSTQKENYIQYYDVIMKNPDSLFLDKAKIDFVKCDVEGYEFEVFSNMKNTILRHRPIVQSELSGEENRKKVIELFESWNFKTYLLEGEKLHQATEIEKTQASQDFYFISL